VKVTLIRRPSVADALITVRTCLYVPEYVKTTTSGLNLNWVGWGQGGVCTRVTKMWLRTTYGSLGRCSSSTLLQPPARSPLSCFPPRVTCSRKPPVRGFWNLKRGVSPKRNFRGVVLSICGNRSIPLEVFLTVVKIPHLLRTHVSNNRISSFPSCRK
jgi:hypothetical protein